MTPFDQPTWTRPESSASTSTDAPRRPQGQAASLLLTAAGDSRHESRRIAIGLGALALLSVILLNFGILQSSRDRLTQQRWGQLADHTDAKREEIRDLLGSSSARPSS
jgi:hypothetical protein